MDKIESYVFLFTRQMKDRPTQEGFTLEEYRELIKRIRNWCDRELKERTK